MAISVVTKFKINRPTSEVFEAIVDPAKIGNFWFSSASARWEAGQKITLRYDEYNAEGEIEVVAIEANELIQFRWGEDHLVTMDLTEDGASTLISIEEAGWLEDAPDLIAQLLDNKGGWTYMLSCLKAYLEHGVTTLRAGLVH